MAENIGITPDSEGNTGQVLPTPSPETVNSPVSVPSAEANPAKGSPTPASERAKAPVSQRKLEANRRNAQKSTGPRTEAGKAKSAANSYTHGFYSKSLFAMTPPERVAEEKADYLALLDGLQEHYQPVGRVENLFCERIAIGMFRCGRLLKCEGRIFSWSDPFYLSCAGNLVRYETSTNRQLQKDISQLERLQEKRKSESS